MRDSILKLAIAALLFVSVESFAEPVDEASFHQTHHAHADDGNQWYPDTDGNDHDSDACEHFCHVHVVALTPQVSIPTLPKSRALLNMPPVFTVHRATAPPTPPPNI